MKRYTRGFTLIELLVVIAIIGILSSVVLVSLNSARSKGGDAATEEQLTQMRSQAELVYSNMNSYGPQFTAAACPTAAANNIFATTSPVNMNNIVIGVTNQAGGVSNTWCSASGGSATAASAWAAAAILKSANTSAWCVDSTGNAKLETGLTANTPSGAISSGACL
jgi:type IV pilus assembly protein PilE